MDSNSIPINPDAAATHDLLDTIELLSAMDRLAGRIEVARLAIIGGLAEAARLNVPTSDLIGFLETPLDALADLEGDAGALAPRFEDFVSRLATRGRA